MKRVFFFRAKNCGTEQFPEARALPNVVLTCDGRNLIVSPKIKQVFSVREKHVHFPSLKEFALRVLHVWKTPFLKDHVPKTLYEQLVSGPAASCMFCLRPMFTYSYMCLFRHG